MLRAIKGGNMSLLLLEATLIVILLVANGLFAMSELAVVTARRARLERLAQAGDSKARAALELAAQPNQFLSMVQVGITLVGTLAGVLGGATIADNLAPILSGVPILGAYSEAASVAIVVALITYFSLILGELVPKRIALGHPEAVARLVATPMRRLARLGRPVVSVLTASTDLVLRLLRFRASDAQHVTEDDIRALVEQGTMAGAVHEEEQEIVGRVLHLSDRPVAAVMTPRTDLSWITVDATPTELRELLFEEKPSWILVCEQHIDDVIGVAGARDLLAGMVAGEPHDLRAAAQPPLFVPEALTMLRLMEELRSSETPVAVVLDEFGGVYGMVTFTDLVTHLVRDLPRGPLEVDAPDVIRRPDGTWLLDGAAPFDEIEEALGIDRPAQEARRDYHTLAGFMLAELGRLPREGDAVEYQGVRFEVVRMDGQRIVRIRAAPVAGASREGGAG